MKPKGRQLYGNQVHRAGQILAAPSTTDLIPDGPDMPDEIVAAWKAKLDHYEANPANMMKQVERIVCAEGLAARLGAYRLDYSKQTQCVECSPVVGGNVRWAEGYFSAHQRTCPWMYEVARMSTDDVEAKAGKKKDGGWQDTDDLQGDPGFAAHGSTKGQSASGAVDLHATNAPSLNDSLERRFVTVVFLWRRVWGEATAEIPDSQTALPPDEQYMQCMQPDSSGCSYNSPTVGEMLADPTKMPPSLKATWDGEGELPPAIPGGCPNCNGDLEANIATVADSTRGAKLHLTIFAPFEGDGGRLFFADFDHFELPTVPYFIWRSHVRPGKPMGQSETSLNMSMQQSSNMLVRLGLENMMVAAKPYVMVPEGLRDAFGEPWQFLSHQGFGMYYDPSMANTRIEWVQAMGIPAGLPQLWSMFDSALRQDFGNDDLTFGPNDSKDIAVGTIRAIQRTKEIPVSDQIDAWRQEKSMVLWALLAMLRATEIDPVATPMQGPTGRKVIHSIAAADLPPMRVIVSADPSSASLVGDTIDNELKIASAPRPQRRLLAQRNNIPQSQIDQLEQDEDAEAIRQAKQASMLQQIAMGGVQGQPGMPGPPMTGGAPPPRRPGSPAGMGAPMNAPAMQGAK